MVCIKQSLIDISISRSNVRKFSCTLCCQNFHQISIKDCHGGHALYGLLLIVIQDKSSGSADLGSIRNRKKAVACQFMSAITIISVVLG